jgi:aspartate 1-decarboxylase
MRAFLKSKIHRATVTEANMNYDGSITIDSTLMVAAGIAEWEKVAIYDVTNGSRIETYAISSISDSGEICVNGAAAHLIKPNDIVIILTYEYLQNNEINNFSPKIVHVDQYNKII